MANGVYWIGNNGNVYTRVAGQDGVKDYGSYEALKRLSSKDPNVGFNYVTSGLDQIDNPSNATPAPSQNDSGGSGYKPFNQAAADATQREMDQIPGLLRDALAAEATRYGNTTATFDAQEKAQQEQYDQSTTTNQQNYDSNLMEAVRAGSRGLGNLLSILRGTGAGGGTAEDWARNAVRDTTSSDIATGADTQKENQTQLDTTLSTFLTDLKGKRQNAEDTFANNKSAIRRDSNVGLRDLLQKMAGYYSDAGNTAQADSFLNRASDLTPAIARDSRTQVSKYDTAPVTVKAPELSAFTGPSQQNLAVAPENGQLGSGIFTVTDPKRRQQAPLQPVGA